MLAAGAMAVCASLTAGCGVVPGVPGGSGDGPVTVMTWAPQHTRTADMPGMPAMAQAYARWINADGGIGGRELRVITCNDHDDTVSAAACAQRAVQEDVTAVVGSYSRHSRAFLSPLEAAGIPYLGASGSPRTSSPARCRTRSTAAGPRSSRAWAGSSPGSAGPSP